MTANQTTVEQLFPLLIEIKYLTKDTPDSLVIFFLVRKSSSRVLDGLGRRRVQRGQLDVVGLVNVHDASQVAQVLAKDEAVEVPGKWDEEEPVTKLAFAHDGVDFAGRVESRLLSEHHLANHGAAEGGKAGDELEAGDDGEDHEPEPDEQEAAKRFHMFSVTAHSQKAYQHTEQ